MYFIRLLKTVLMLSCDSRQENDADLTKTVSSQPSAWHLEICISKELHLLSNSWFLFTTRTPARSASRRASFDTHKLGLNFFLLAHSIVSPYACCRACRKLRRCWRRTLRRAWRTLLARSVSPSHACFIYFFLFLLLLTFFPLSHRFL